MVKDNFFDSGQFKFPSAFRKEKEEDAYIVVNNSSSSYNASLDRFAEVKSSLSDDAFDLMIRTFAEENNIEKCLSTSGTVILKGTIEDYERVKLHHGTSFSYLFVNESEMERVVDQLGEYHMETEEDYEERALPNIDRSTAEPH